MTDPDDRHRITRPPSPTALAATIQEHGRQHQVDAFMLDGPAVTAPEVPAIATALASLDGTYRFGARARPPLDTAAVRALHRAGFDQLELDPGDDYGAVLQTLRACDELGVSVRYDPAALHDHAPAPLADTIPTLVHLTPPRSAPDDQTEGRTAQALTHWRAVHATGLLSARRGPDALRIADSRAMAWGGHRGGARPRLITVRDGDRDVYELFETPRTPREAARLCAELEPERFVGFLTTLVRLSLLVPCGERDGQPLLLALATSAPPWWERDPTAARPPPESIVPVDSPAWAAMLREQPWAWEPARRPRHERHLAVIQDPRA